MAINVIAHTGLLFNGLAPFVESKAATRAMWNLLCCAKKCMCITALGKILIIKLLTEVQRIPVFSSFWNVLFFYNVNAEGKYNVCSTKIMKNITRDFLNCK